MGNQRLGHAAWEAHISSWERSGMAQRHYCTAKGLKIRTFIGWREKLRPQPSKEPKVKFEQVTIKSTQEQHLGRKVVLHCILPNGIRLGVSEEASEHFIRHVVNAVGAL